MQFVEPRASIRAMISSKYSLAPLNQMSVRLGKIERVSEGGGSRLVNAERPVTIGGWNVPGTGNINKEKIDGVSGRRKWIR